MDTSRILHKVITSASRRVEKSKLRFFCIASSYRSLYILYYRPSCPDSAIQMDKATWAVWTATKKYSLICKNENKLKSRSSLSVSLSIGMCTQKYFRGMDVG